MFLFLITFLTIYGGMHIYAFVRLRNTFLLRPHLTWLLIAWMLIMTIIPLLVRTAEQFGKEKMALCVAWPGYLWMGFIFIFTSNLLFIDALGFIYRIAIQQFYKQTPNVATSRYSCMVALALAISASIYAYIEAGRIRSEHVVITSSKIPGSISRIRIVHISDVHIGLLMPEKRLRKIVEKVKEAGPDILISTGDLIDGKLNREDAISNLNPLAALLASIPASSGKFAVIGNHEVYAGLPQALAFSHAAGFTVLRNQSTRLANGITISGIDDKAATGKIPADPTIESSLLNSVAQDSFHLFLNHRPEIPPGCDGRFDLQLSGHVHGGQIFPFNLFVRLYHPIPCGLTTTQKGSHIYVSRGAGTWGPPMRLFAPPEVTTIDIIPQPGAR